MELEPGHLQAVIDRLDRANEMLAIIAGTQGQPYYRPPATSVLVNSAGFATIAYQSFPGGVDKLWLVDKMFVYTNTAATTIKLGVFLMEGLPAGATQDNPNSLAVAIDPLNQVDATTFAIVAGDELKPQVVKGGEALVFQWSGLTQNDKCIARIQYRLAWQGQG